MPDAPHHRILSASGTPVTRFGEIEARFVVERASVGAESILMGTAVYPPGSRIDEHFHPNAEEVVLVLSGSAVHVVDGQRFEMRAGDFCFIPRRAVHALEAAGGEQLEILWAYGGASSLEEAGFVAVGESA